MNKPLIYPVIHQLTPELSLQQADLAFECGADGVFLISHTCDNLALLPVARKIKHKYPYNKIGINLLGHDTMDTIDLAMEYFIDMVWFDYCGISSSGFTQEALRIDAWKQDHSIIDFDVFASVAFKYQAPELNPELAATYAKLIDCIPTTSGTATGHAPELAKISSMSKATDGTLAVASGMDVNNVSEFAPYLSHILVSTGVSDDFHHINPELLTEFIKRSRNQLT